MKAIILAAGVGRRFGDGAAEHPKSLLDLEGRSLLDRMLDALQTAGAAEVVVVTGYEAEQIEAVVANRPRVRTVRNPEYRKGAILSLWCAREELDEAVLIMDADVLFPAAMLQRLVTSPHANCFLMDTDSANDGEAMMLMAREGRVVDITRGVRGSYDACGESVGFLKLDAEGARALRVLLESAIAQGLDGGEHEETYPELMRQCVIGYEPVAPYSWIEIDFPEDVARARELVRQGFIA